MPTNDGHDMMKRAADVGSSDGIDTVSPRSKKSKKDKKKKPKKKAKEPSPEASLEPVEHEVADTPAQERADGDESDASETDSQ